MREAFDVMASHPWLTFFLVLAIYLVIEQICATVESSIRKRNG